MALVKREMGIIKACAAEIKCLRGSARRPMQEFDRKN